MATIIVQPGGPRAGRQRLDLTAVAHNRLMLLLLMFMGVTALVVCRLLWVGVFAHGAASDDGLSAFLPARADIVDRNGVPLARTMDAYSIAVKPSKLIGEPAEIARKLHEIFPDESEAAFYKKLTGRGWSYLRRRAMPEEVAAVNALGEIGIEFPREKERLYPQRTLAAHVLGYVGADGGGHVGMEEVFDKQLTDPATRGAPVALAIDARVQAALEDELYRVMGLAQAKGAGGIVMDVDTGEVVALASLPTFDPNHIDERGMELMFNRVTNQVYELGSTFKPLSVAAAIDAGTVGNLARRWPTGAPLRVGRFSIRDSHTIGASLNVPEILMHSSNIGTAQIADELGSARMKAKMEQLGFNERPHIELPARGFPIWRSGEWPRLTTMTVSYGHGIAVTPLHLASAYAAMVNGGIWRPATLKKLNAGEVPQGRRVFKEATSARMRQMLRMIVTDGTGRKADAPGFRIGGKTGSAEKPGAGGYKRTSLVTTFASAFPMDNPRYVVVAMMDEPQGTAATSYQRTAAWNAAMVVGNVVPRIGPMLGVYPDDSRDIDLTDLRPLVGKDAH